MHDCQIPTNVQSRDADIKKYVDKLGELETEFDSCKKINDGSNIPSSPQQDEINELVEKIEGELDGFNQQKIKF